MPSPSRGPVTQNGVVPSQRLVLPGPDYESGGRKRRCRLEGTGELTEQLPRIKSAHDSELIFNPEQTQFSSRFTYDYLMFNQ
ncbi:hypothetical protein NQZ68_012482 [Dissostichus eleginoides]|nr:hypothetical protein NQZ68_012482 [Dissostichus eleginoides]